MAILTQFTVFPKLSDDLKAMIWDLVSQQSSRIRFESYQVRAHRAIFSESKVNELVPERDKLFHGKHPAYPRPWRVSAEGRVPSVLITCRQSRYWAMKHYRLEFKYQLYSKALWFNPKVDTLIFDKLNTLLIFVEGGCTNNMLTSSFKDNTKMPVVERIALLESHLAYRCHLAIKSARNFPYLKSLITRTDDIVPEAVLPSLRVQMNQLWYSDEWKAIRAYSQIPGLRTLTAYEMMNTGLAEPFGPSNKPPKRRRRNIKVDPSQMPPVRRSDRIKSMETKQYLEN
ncbi:uncharacterized protein EAE97_011902 [Botrytis byssoidea]|uniref:2EXR domain-containing protein n=1 Tax=Botrytis byssoidea TaxID=139641 RepID=A0A9P5LQM9_9HELO|nr:uncharacterized protein EAE97_011902 [Botrytis byssoidea]KAF7918131.1 hypothetical protein EAE97_011902 [Botrytis byssoidea]